MLSTASPLSFRSSFARLGPLILTLASIVSLWVLAALLVVYLATGDPAFPLATTFPTVSDVGVAHQALFIAGGCTVAALIFAGLTAGAVGAGGQAFSALPPTEQALTLAGGLFGVTSITMLILLTCIPSGPAHIAFAWVFFVALALALASELALMHLARRRLGLPHPKCGWALAASAVALAVLLLVGAAILEVICGGASAGACDAPQSTAAALEWVGIAALALGGAALGVDALAGPARRHTASGWGRARGSSAE
jgi:hypothetical protein